MQSLFFLIITMFQMRINKKITFNKHFARKYIRAYTIPGKTALDGLITAKKRIKVISRETADVVRVEDELQPRYRRGRTWGKIGTASDAEESFELLNTLARGQARTAHVVRTCNTRETHVIIRVPAVIKS